MEAFKSLHKNQGQSIIEVLVALGLLVVIGMTLIGGIVSLRNITKGSVTLSATDKQINDIAENIKSGVENYQINFNPKGAADALAIDSLPMVWDVGFTSTREDCLAAGAGVCNAAGSYGYVITPYDAFRGLYLVTLRMTYKSWDKYREYQFVVSAK